jgi:hypothetical protein
LWLGITVSGESASGPFSAATHGLAAFGYREFEVRGAHMRVGDLRAALYDLALYVLHQRVVLKHGQTIGPSADVKWPIRHDRSRFVDDREVVVLGLP